MTDRELVAVSRIDVNKDINEHERELGKCPADAQFCQTYLLQLYREQNRARGPTPPISVLLDGRTAEPGPLITDLETLVFLSLRCIR